jgi:hypothetical protein
MSTLYAGLLFYLADLSDVARLLVTIFILGTNGAFILSFVRAWLTEIKAHKALRREQKRAAARERHSVHFINPMLAMKGGGGGKDKAKPLPFVTEDIEMTLMDNPMFKRRGHGIEDTTKHEPGRSASGMSVEMTALGASAAGVGAAATYSMHEHERGTPAERPRVRGWHRRVMRGMLLYPQRIREAMGF